MSPLKENISRHAGGPDDEDDDEDDESSGSGGGSVLDSTVEGAKVSSIAPIRCTQRTTRDPPAAQLLRIKHCEGSQLGSSRCRQRWQSLQAMWLQLLQRAPSG